jgi:hypothetical protein
MDIWHFGLLTGFRVVLKKILWVLLSDRANFLFFRLRQIPNFSLPKTSEPVKVFMIERKQTN